MMNLKARQAFSKQAWHYDNYVDIHAEIAQRLMHSVPPKQYRQIVELGCGTGLLSQLIAKAYPLSTLTLVDFSKDMLQVCQHKLSTNENVNYQHQAIETFMLPPNTDLVLSSMCLHWVEDLAGYLARLKNMMGKGCRFHFAILTQNSLQQWRDLCLAFTGRSPTLYFPEINIFQKIFRSGQFEFQTKNVMYQSCQHFLKTLKNFGGATSCSAHQTFSIREMKTLLAAFNLTKPYMSYDIIYGDIIL